ncbi:hypothetical protein B0H14DRAFT_3754330 [Mycena olivaceomarginata]|nr:hypothetical protein B0H14DRAFT_3754330 [Mycena olivaceomarginata]
MALANARSDFDLLCRDTQTRRHPLVNLTIALHEKPSAGHLSFLNTRVRADTSGTACHRAGKREGSPRLSFGVIAGDWDCRLFHESPRRAVRPSMSRPVCVRYSPNSGPHIPTRYAHVGTEQLRACLSVLAKAELIAPAKPRRTSALNGYEISVYHISTKIGMRGTFTACVDLYGLSQGRRCQYHSSHKLKTRLAEFRGGKNTTGPRGN